MSTRPTTGRAAGAGDAFAKLRARSRLWSVGTWLIVLCIAIHVIVTLLARVGPNFVTYGAFTVSDTLAGQVWRLVTFQFLHGGLFHLGMNCLGIWFFGPMVERRLGKARMLAFYLLCGFGGAAGFMLLYFTGIITATPTTPLIGASAGVFGLIAGAMRLLPDRILNLQFPPIDITVFRFGAVYLSLAAFIVLAHGNNAYSNAGGEAAHLGGAAIGWLLAGKLAWLAWADRLVPAKLRMPGTRNKAEADVKVPDGWTYHGWR